MINGAALRRLRLVGLVRCRIARALAAVAYILAAETGASAFSSDEHYCVSVAAFRVAAVLRYGLPRFCSQPTCASASSVASALPMGGGLEQPVQALAGMLVPPDVIASCGSRASRCIAECCVTYGDLVVLVDHVADPLRLLRRSEAHRLDDSVAESASDLNVQQLRTLSRRLGARLRALHNNTSHFQDEAYQATAYWHSAAVLEAWLAGRDAAQVDGSVEHSLYGALVMNAIGDHFLQDSLAPGHNVSPRGSYPDYAANNLHDTYNFEGRCYYPSTDLPWAEWRRAARVLARDDQLRRALGFSDEGSAIERFDEIAPLSTGGKIQQDVAARRSDHMRGEGPAEEKRRCRVEEGALHFRGDKDLLEPARFGTDEGECESSRCEAESERQRLFVFLATAQSVGEVLDAFERGRNGLSRPTRSELFIGPFAWTPMTHVADRPWGAHRVALAGGRTKLGGFVRPERSIDERVRYGFMGLLELSSTTFLEGHDESGRGALALDWVLAWGPPGRFDRESGSYESKSLTIAPSLGIAHRFDEELEGRDATFRANLIWADVDMRASFGVRVSRFRWDGQTSTRVTPEVRFGKSFGLLELFVGVSRDRLLDEQRDLDAALGFQAGVAIAVPWWRVARGLEGLSSRPAPVSTSAAMHTRTNAEVRPR